MSEPISAQVAQNGKTFLLFKGIKFIFISYVVSFLMVLILSALVVYTDLPEAFCGPSIKVITFFGAFLSAFLTSRASDGRGWLCGAVSGCANIALLSLLGTAIYGTSVLSASNVLGAFYGLLAGGAGGIVGINTKRN